MCLALLSKTSPRCFKYTFAFLFDSTFHVHIHSLEDVFSPLARTEMDSIWRQCDVLRWLRSSCNRPNPALFLSMRSQLFQDCAPRTPPYDSVRATCTNSISIGSTVSQQEIFLSTTFRSEFAGAPWAHVHVDKTDTGSMVPPIIPHTMMFQYSSS